MGDGGRLALGILMFLGAGFLFFFAFHPGGVETVTSPADMLKWLMGEFNSLTGSGGDSAPGNSASLSQLSPTGLAFVPTPTGQPSGNQAVTE
jgi:hypothetical protein